MARPLHFIRPSLTRYVSERVVSRNQAFRVSRAAPRRLKCTGQGSLPPINRAPRLPRQRAPGTLTSYALAPQLSLPLLQFASSHIRPYSDARQDGSTPSTSPPKEATQQDSTPQSAQLLAQRIKVTREATKELRAKVQSSLSGLTPRENIYNLPNFLTVTRLIAAPTIAYLLLRDQQAWALALFAYAGVTDLVDGWLARRWKVQTVVGSVIDPGADKALMIALTVTLAVKGALPVSLATLILGRDAALLIGAIYYRYASLPSPKTFMRYWDFSLPSAEVHPTTLSKYNTFLQLILIGSTLALPVVTADSHHLSIMSDFGLQNVDLDQIMHYFQWLIAGTTVWSGLSYAYLKDAVKILGSDGNLKVKQGKRGRAIIGVTFGSVVAVAVWLALKDDNKKHEEEINGPAR